MTDTENIQLRELIKRRADKPLTTNPSVSLLDPLMFVIDIEPLARAKIPGIKLLEIEAAVHEWFNEITSI